MSQDLSRSPLGTTVLLLAGVLVGGLLAAGAVAVTADLIRGDAPAQAAGPPDFVEESLTSGIEHSYTGEFEYFVGGGVAVFDCNADHYPDLYFAGGSQPASLYANTSSTGGALRFELVEDREIRLAGVAGAYPLDVDSDGVTDLAVLRVGENVMFRGLGDCRFERANEIWGIDGGESWTAAFSATWEEGQSLPTLVFGNYLSLDALDERDECDEHHLHRPEDGRYGDPVTLSPGRCTLSILFSDWARTGARDLRMTNDRHYYREGEEQLWRLRPGEKPELYSRADGWREMRIWGMGIASHDVTGDGLPEVFLTSQGDNKLQTLTEGAAGPEYEDIALQYGVTAHRPFQGDINRPSTAWHAEFGDVNNDGFVDLFVTKGNVDSQPEFAMDDPNNLLLGTPDGNFEESAQEAGLLDYGLSRGGAVADLNADGLLDVVVVERREQVRIWRNIGSADAGNWLAVDLTQPGPNTDAIGAWLELRIGSTTLRSELTVGGGHAGGELGPIHFGIGTADSVSLRVIWPDGEPGPWHTVDANKLVVVDRASGTASPTPPLAD